MTVLTNQGLITQFQVISITVDIAGWKSDWGDVYLNMFIDRRVNRPTTSDTALWSAACHVPERQNGRRWSTVQYAATDTWQKTSNHHVTVTQSVSISNASSSYRHCWSPSSRRPQFGEHAKCFFWWGEEQIWGWQQVVNFPVYGEATGERVRWISSFLSITPIPHPTSWRHGRLNSQRLWRLGSSSAPRQAAPVLTASRRLWFRWHILQQDVACYTHCQWKKTFVLEKKCLFLRMWFLGQFHVLYVIASSVLVLNME